MVNPIYKRKNASFELSLKIYFSNFYITKSFILCEVVKCIIIKNFTTEFVNLPHKLSMLTALHSTFTIYIPNDIL